MKKILKCKKILLFIGIIVLGVLYTFCSLYLSKHYLTTTTYKYDSDKINQQVNIVVLTDEHGNSFGKDNSKLITQVEKLSPDMIVIVGDAINFYSENDQFLIEVVTSLSKISEVYFTIGNHEAEYMVTNKTSVDILSNRVKEAGGMYLDQDYIDLIINNQSIRLGGLYDYTFNNTNVPLEQYYQKDSYLFLKDFQNTSAFKLMLTHRPESYITNDKDAKWTIDLVLSGHEHGGQVRIPFYGGIYSTHLGWFSEYLDGYHMVNGIPVVISKGLGTYDSKVTPPRFNNLPEIVKIELS